MAVVEVLDLFEKGLVGRIELVSKLGQGFGVIIGKVFEGSEKGF